MASKHTAADYIDAFCIGFDAGIVELDERYLASTIVDARTLDHQIKRGGDVAALERRAEAFKRSMLAMQRAGLMQVVKPAKGSQP